MKTTNLSYDLAPVIKNKVGGIFYKDTLPLMTRADLSYNECIVVELKFAGKQIFFTVIYRNPSNKAGSPEFNNFLTDLENICSRIVNVHLHAELIAVDCQQWWSEGDSNKEGIAIDNLTSKLELSQLISEPTNFQEYSAPSCIDLLFCDQPNLVIESGTSPSLDPFCKHQITFCNLNYLIPPSPAFRRKTWQYNKSDKELLQRSLSEFPWRDTLNSNTNPNWQIATFNTVLLNIMSNRIVIPK